MPIPNPTHITVTNRRNDQFLPINILITEYKSIMLLLLWTTSWLSNSMNDPKKLKVKLLLVAGGAMLFKV